MAQLKLVLDKRRIKSNGTYPLVFRLTNNGQTRDLSTDYSLSEKDWSQSNSTIKKTVVGFESIQKELNRLKALYLNKIIEFESKHERSYNLQELKEYILAKPIKKLKVYDFWFEQIVRLKKSQNHGNARIYKMTLDILQKIKSLNTSFENIDYRFLKEIETELLARNVKINSIGVYMRTFRAVFNQAIKAKIINRSVYPFNDYKIRKASTRPRTITLDEMRKYFALGAEIRPNLMDSYLMGKLMFMLIGINFKDLVLLSEKQIVSGRIVYRRAKTCKLYSIKLLPQTLQIIEHFKGRSESTLLGKLSFDEIKSVEHLPYSILQKNKVFNAQLSKIGKLLGIKEKLTGYVFRYTWANIAKQLGFSKDLISEALGHDYGNRVTSIYLENCDEKVIDEMNEIVNESLRHS